jgi:hypothetical protein
VGVAKPKSLPDTHPAFVQQTQEEPIPLQAFSRD